MRLKDIIGLVIALILAIFVAFLTRYFLTKEEKPKQVVQVQKIMLPKIYVAARSLHEGDIIRPGDVALQEWPQKSISPNYIKEGTAKAEDFIGSVVRGHFEVGEPIIASDLVKPGEKGILAAVVSPGKRAISIEVTAQSASSGLIFPGDFVDVILSKSVTAHGGTQQGESKVVAANLKVLAMDTELSDAHMKPKKVPHVATLEVTPAEAEHITAALKEGTLSLSLHSIEKSTVVPEEIEKKAPSKRDTIILMRGNKKTEVNVQEK
jgi:pilus assembly protein CpaB